MARYLVVGDPHLKISSLDLSKRVLDFLLNIKDVHHVVIMGDMFDTHSIMRVEILNLWVNYFKTTKVGHTLLKGNHDETAPGSNNHALVALEKWAQVVDNLYIDGDKAFVPYVHSEAEFVKYISKIPVSVKYLFCHQTFDGAQYENGFYDPNGFKLEIVARFKKVISGHVHKQQNVANVFYVGTPYAMNFNDAGESKGVWIWETMDDTWEFVQSPCPKYKILEVVTLEGIMAFFDSADTADHHKIVFKGTRSAAQGFLDSKEYKAIKKKFKIMFVPEYNDVKSSTVQIAETLTLEKMMDIYIQKVLKTDLDRTLLTDLSKEILQTANTDSRALK